MRPAWAAAPWGGRVGLWTTVVYDQRCEVVRSRLDCRETGAKRNKDKSTNDLSGFKSTRNEISMISYVMLNTIFEIHK